MLGDKEQKEVKAMGYIIKIEYANREKDGEIILGGKKIEVDNVAFTDVKEGPVFIGLLKNLTLWMKKNIVKAIEIEEQ